jgi:hypothetical protein
MTLKPLVGGALLGALLTWSAAEPVRKAEAGPPTGTGAAREELWRSLYPVESNRLGSWPQADRSKAALKTPTDFDFTDLTVPEAVDRILASATAKVRVRYSVPVDTPAPPRVNLKARAVTPWSALGLIVPEEYRWGLLVDGTLMLGMREENAPRPAALERLIEKLERNALRDDARFSIQCYPVADLMGRGAGDLDVLRLELALLGEERGEESYVRIDDDAPGFLIVRQNHKHHQAIRNELASRRSALVEKRWRIRVPAPLEPGERTARR